MSTDQQTDQPAGWHVARARIAKATVIANFLKGEGVTAAEAVDYSEAARRAAAKLAGKTGCSAETWALVITELVTGTPPWKVATVAAPKRLRFIGRDLTPEYAPVPAIMSCACTIDLHPMATVLDVGIAICPTHGPVTIAKQP